MIILKNPILFLRSIKKKKILFFIFFKLFKKKIIFSYRGYLKLKKIDKLDTLHRLKSELADIKISYTDMFLEKQINKKISIYIIKQYISNKFLALNTSFSFYFYYYYYTNKGFIFPLPKDYLNYINKNYIKVNFFASNFLWFTVLILLLLKNFLKTLSFYFNICYKKNLFNENLNIFLGSNNHINKNFYENNFFFQQLLKKKELKKNKILVQKKKKNFINDQLFEIENFYFQPKNFLYFLKFNFFFFVIFFYTLINLISFRFERFLYFHDIIKFFAFRCSKVNNCNFIFSDDWVIRPIWTYNIEFKKCRSIYYYYSSNVEGYNIKNKSNLPFFMMKNLTWDVYVVFDNYQKNFLDKINILKVKFYFLLEKNKQISKSKKRKIVVFDVIPFKKLDLYLHDIRYDSLSFFYRKKFINDIVECSKKFKTEIILKPKRPVSDFNHKTYVYYLESLKQKKIITIAKHDSILEELLDDTDFSISCPFTSTALIGNSRGKDAIYYDTTNLISKNDLGAHKLRVLQNQDELINFFQKYYYDH